jgi:hypothetical protein
MLAWENSLLDPISKKWAGGVALGEVPEFKPLPKIPQKRSY